jgi:hypothetical protein
MKFHFALISACLIASAQAAIIVDGDTDDWDLDTDFLSDMYNAGEKDTTFSGYDLSSKAYARHSCDTNTLCILVKAEGSNTIDETTGDAWFKDYTDSNGGTQYTSQGFEWVKDESGLTVGWEGCFTVPEDYESSGVRTVEIHADYNDGTSGGKTTSTGKKTGNKALPLETTWECYVTPVVTPTAPTPTAPTPTAPTGDINGGGNAVGVPTAPTPVAAPTEGGGGFGDPHFKTWLGDMYDFHGQCDLILTKSAGFGGGLGLEIQVRTEIRHDWSFIAETAVKIGNDVLEVGSHAAFHMNGVAAEQLTKSADLQELSGFPVRYFNYGSRRHKFEVDLGAKGKVVIKVYNEFVAVAIDDGDLEDFRDSVGLMGSYLNGKLVARDGHFITDAKEFAFEWQVRDTDKMLFQEAKGPQYPQQCRMPSAKAVKRRRLLESMVSYKEAEHACAGFEEEVRESCIFDVLSTGDLKMADAGAM